MRGISGPERGGRDRQLDWEGCFNVRDLGGLPTVDGFATRWGAVVRADALDSLSAIGWEALWTYGVRTVIDLRNDEELGSDAAPRPPGLTTIHLPLDGIEHHDFWSVWKDGPQFGTPLYYGPHLECFPERSAAVLSAIARAAPGGVVFHCGGGRDRTGQIAMLLLALVGVPPSEIAADYALSGDRLKARCASRGEADQGPLLAAYLAERGTTPVAVIEDTLAALDVRARMRKAGLSERDAAALCRRLLAT